MYDIDIKINFKRSAKGDKFLSISAPVNAYPASISPV